jgi:hypothetical protein
VSDDGEVHREAAGEAVEAVQGSKGIEGLEILKEENTKVGRRLG